MKWNEMKIRLVEYKSEWTEWNETVRVTGLKWNHFLKKLKINLTPPPSHFHTKLHKYQHTYVCSSSYILTFLADEMKMTEKLLVSVNFFNIKFATWYDMEGLAHNLMDCVGLFFRQTRGI